jgi:hypothetical protein
MSTYKIRTREVTKDCKSNHQANLLGLLHREKRELLLVVEEYNQEIKELFM